ncbi:transmembrane protease serine 9 [Galleria mellonella]|uniref:Transmembrane protease serine 9 n=1 Tax=Galleria mellonella TaxID=7137 RepID=A0ABM3MAQ4_GALME|nr:transmembrane protease serine 9 [Galleria mellonella]
MWRCASILLFTTLTFTCSQADVVRDARGVFTKNFFGGVWGNRPPLMENNLPKTTCTCKCGERNEVSRIVGGEEAGTNEFPWIARLTYFKRFYCGGMLINDRYVLTAAHCVKGFMWFMIKVTFGEHNRCNATIRPETRFVLRAIANKFSLSNFDNDIALLRLNERVPISDAIKPICLPSNNNNLYVGVKAVAAGWGTLTEEGKVSCTLQEVEVPVISNEDCRKTKYTASMISDNMLCAGYPKTGEKDSCQGDSGGPLITERKYDKRYELIGVVSWGNGCARVGYPGVYTRVTNYLDWIRENTKDACYYSLIFILAFVSVGLSMNKDALQVTETSFRSPLQFDYFAEKKVPDCQNCGCGDRNEELRVVGGVGSNMNAYPWLARLIYHKSFGCGASLINDRYVISAAHCVKGFMWFMFRVTFGEHNRCDRTPPPDSRFVVKIIAHNFSLTTLMNDIALIHLNKPITYSHAVRPVCLPTNPDKDYVGTMALVAGWGATGETGNWSCTVLEADLPVLSNEVCQSTNYNASKIKDVMMCAGYPATAHKDACTGDSGGPLVAENKDHAYELIGIVSWGYGCARKGYPGVYTRVTKYLDWIRDNTADGCYCSY